MIEPEATRGYEKLRKVTRIRGWIHEVIGKGDGRRAMSDEVDIAGRASIFGVLQKWQSRQTRAEIGSLAALANPIWPASGKASLIAWEMSDAREKTFFDAQSESSERAFQRCLSKSAITSRRKRIFVRLLAVEREGSPASYECPFSKEDCSAKQGESL